MIGHEHFYTQCEYPAAKGNPFLMMLSKSLSPNFSSTSHDGCAERTSPHYNNLAPSVFLSLECPIRTFFSIHVASGVKTLIWTFRVQTCCIFVSLAFNLAKVRRLQWAAQDLSRVHSWYLTVVRSPLSWLPMCALQIFKWFSPLWLEASFSTHTKRCISNQWSPSEERQGSSFIFFFFVSKTEALTIQACASSSTDSILSYCSIFFLSNLQATPLFQLCFICVVSFLFFLSFLLFELQRSNSAACH